MDKRYTIFVSSTYTDLKEQRNAVIRAVMEAGHVPLGMEAFGAANASQWQIITDTIDTADYYVLIIGARYGSVDEMTGASFTEMEFDYAVAQEIPVLVFAMAEGVQVLPEHVDNPEKVKAFKAKATYNRQSAFWSNSDDLANKVMRALTAEFRRTPRPGWVRPSPVAGPGVAEELARLSEENSRLKAEAVRNEVTYGGQEVDQLLRVLTADAVSASFINVRSETTLVGAKITLMSLLMLVSEVLERGVSRWGDIKSEILVGAQGIASAQLFQGQEVKIPEMERGAVFLYKQIRRLRDFRIISLSNPEDHQLGTGIKTVNKLVSLTDLGDKIVIEAKIRRIKPSIDHYNVD